MKHQLSNYNITDPRLQELPVCDWCYTDPPWGEGNLKYWKTMSDKMGGNMAHQTDQQTMEHIIVDLIGKKVRHQAFIVYGIREAASLMEKIEAAGYAEAVQYVQKEYRAGSKWLPNCIICVTMKGEPVRDYSYLSKYKNSDSLVQLSKEFQGKYDTCLELFVGVGYYLKILDKYGYTVIGNEANNTRLQRAIAKVQ